MSDLNVILQTEFRNYKQDTMSIITYGNSSYLHTTNSNTNIQAKIFKNIVIYDD
jgi:hypothetical protein